MPQNLLIYCNHVPWEDFGGCFYAFEVFPFFAKFSHGATLGNLSSSEDMLSSPPRPAGRPQDKRKTSHAALTRAMGWGQESLSPKRAPSRLRVCRTGPGRNSESREILKSSQALASGGKASARETPQDLSSRRPQAWSPASPSLALGPSPPDARLPGGLLGPRDSVTQALGGCRWVSSPGFERRLSLRHVSTVGAAASLWGTLPEGGAKV